MINKIIIFVLAVVVVAVGAFFIFFKKEASGFKAYSNQELGFEIKYPAQWRSEECTYEGFGIVGFGDSEEKLLICNSDAPPLSNVNVQIGGPASEFDLLLKSLEDNLDNFSKENTELGGRPAVKIYGETRQTDGPGLPAGTEMTVIMAKEDGKVYSVSHWNLENKDYLAEYNQIISTINFLEGDVACIQVITSARNQATGETKDFPTPCDVPEGWTII